MRSSTFFICWISGSTSRTPGPLTPVKRPSVNITPRSYSFRTRIDPTTTSSNTMTMTGKVRNMGKLLMVLQRLHKEGQVRHFDDAGLLARTQRTWSASVPQFSTITHDAPILAIADCFNSRANHRLDTGTRRPPARAGRQPADGGDDEPAGHGDSDDQRQCHAQPR